jgi:hypothetical protein
MKAASGSFETLSPSFFKSERETPSWVHVRGPGRAAVRRGYWASGKPYAPPVSGTEPRSARVGAMLGRPVNARELGFILFCVVFLWFFCFTVFFFVFFSFFLKIFEHF